MSRPKEKKLWACKTCGVTFVSRPPSTEPGVSVDWTKHGGGIRRTTVSITTDGECPGCGTADPDVMAVRPQR